jgi:hypothetical protein
VAFVCADYESTGFRDSEVHAGDADLGIKEAIAELVAGCFGEVFRICRSGGGTELFVEELADLFFADVDRGRDDVTRMLMSELDDPLAQVGVGDLDAERFEMRVEAAFFGEHRFAFDDAGSTVTLDDAGDDAVVFRGIAGPVDLSA